MFKQKQVIAKAIDTLVADVKNFVALNGGFIATTNGEFDTIYAYVIDWDYDDVSEQRVIAVRVKDNELQVIATPYKTDVYDEPLTEDYFTDDEWYYVGTCGDNVLTAQTILSIADSIEQYV
jgi:hypothetical protein